MAGRASVVIDCSRTCQPTEGTRMSTARRAIGALSLVCALLGATSAAQAATQTVTSDDGSQGWVSLNEGPAGSSGGVAFVAGPAPAPLGVGSARLSVDGTARQILSTQAFAGTRLADISSLAYSTHGPSGLLAASLQFDVDYDTSDAGTAWQGRLVFEPYQSGVVQPDVWQTWAPMSGKWWASGAPGNAVCPQASPCTWAQVLGAFPDAGLWEGFPTRGFVHLRAGGPWSGGFTGHVDALSIGVGGDATTFDFEPPLSPGSRDDCRNGGWQTFNTPVFRNQGACVSSFAPGRAG
jgi:hypothetical protein